MQADLDRAVTPPAITGAVLALRQPHRIQFDGASGRVGLRNANATQPNARFRAGSITKLFTAVLVLQLVDEGRIALSDSLPALWPEIAKNAPHADDITLERLLNHTSGLTDFASQPGFLAAVRTDPHRHWEPEELVAIALAAGPVHPPGGDWYYASTNYVILGSIAERASGLSLPELLHTKITRPLGLTNTTYPSDQRLDAPYLGGAQDTDADGDLDDVTDWDPSYAGAAGTVITTSADLCAFLSALMHGTLLRAPTLERMLQPVPTDREGAGYGLGITVLGDELYGHAGLLPGYTAGAFIHRDADVSVALCLNAGDEANAGLSLLLRAFDEVGVELSPRAEAALRTANFPIDALVAR